MINLSVLFYACRWGQEAHLASPMPVTTKLLSSKDDQMKLTAAYAIGISGTVVSTDASMFLLGTVLLGLAIGLVIYPVEEKQS